MINVDNNFTTFTFVYYVYNPVIYVFKVEINTLYLCKLYVHNYICVCHTLGRDTREEDLVDYKHVQN